MLKFKWRKFEQTASTPYCLFETWSGIFLIFCSICVSVAQANGINHQKDEKHAMATLVIDLQNGFLDESVIIQVDGKKIFHKREVNTDYTIGRADSVKIQVPKRLVKIKVTALSRKLSNIFALDVSANTYLGISILDEQIIYRVSDEIFLYY